MLKLYVLRHGKAVNPKGLRPDFDRKLNKKGTAQVNQIGYVLQREKVKIGQLITSGSRRTLETAEIIDYYLQVPEALSFNDLYLSPKETILRILAAEGRQNTILLVGHNFGISDFVNYLTGENLLLSTSMLVQINFNFDDWKMLSAETGTIERITEPQVHSF